MGLRLGLCGGGVFSAAFAPLFLAHPEIDTVVLAEADRDKRVRFAERFELDYVCESLEQLCDSDVDAIAIFTQNTMHGPQAVQALRSGKHVYSAVPAVTDLEQLADLVHTVEVSGLVYMMGETSYYYPPAIYCRDRFRAGDFGQVVYGEAEYFHDMSSLYAVYQHRFGDEWRSNAGIPPMYYPTHSTSMIISVTGAHVTHVSCMGVVDQHEDALFGKGANLWNNPFSNQVALCRMSDGSVARFTEFRRVAEAGGRGHGLRLYGTTGSFEQQSLGPRYSWVDSQDGESTLTDVTALLATGGPVGSTETEGEMDADWARSAMAQVHPVGRLPEAFRGLPNGHNGSHQFLVDDFVRSCLNRVVPPINVWQAARYQAPGLVAHESAVRNGELMPVPDFGDPPATLGIPSMLPTDADTPVQSGSPHP